MNRKLEKPTPAQSLLALILAGDGTAQINAESGKLEIGPAKLANRLKDRIIAHKADLIRILLGISCPLCGFSLRIGTQARLLSEKRSDGAYLLPRYCENCGKRGEDLIQPDFPVLDKSGKEI